MAPRLFLDLDGVLADFDRGVVDLLGMPSARFEKRYGIKEFWRRLAKAPDFYARLPLMPDARLLFDAIEHLTPTILTGLPLGKWAAPQKVAWCEEHFPRVPVITCMARDKHRFMDPGDVLVDDRDRHRPAYEAHGVVFVHHKNAKQSLRELRSIYQTIQAPADSAA
jgi:5'(3')-deoxyribonucleotidase